MENSQRDKLIEIVGNLTVGCGLHEDFTSATFKEKYTEAFIVGVANELLANGVTTPLRLCYKEEALADLNNNKGCKFCTISDCDIDGSVTYGREEDNYILYAGYSKQYDVDKFDEFETEEIKFCPMCGRKLKGKNK